MHHRGTQPPPARHPARPVGRPLAFTLVELLIVIGIIAVLISLLLPAVGKVRIAGQKVATQATLNRISQGCEAYFQDFGAYPGPFGDDQLVHVPVSATDSTPTTAYLDPTTNTNQLMYNGAPFPHAPTSSENLFLGLCGGLRLVTTTGGGGGTTFTYDPDLAKRGLGPSGLSQGVAKRSQAYFDLSLADISASEETANPLNDPTRVPAAPPSWWWPGTARGGTALGAGFVGDSPIYEFVDRFNKPKPILYLRAKRGVTRAVASTNDRSGFLLNTTSAATITQTTPYQYRADQITIAYASIGFVTDSTGMRTPLDGQIWSARPSDYPALMDEPSQPTVVKIQAGDERYYANEQASTGDATTMNDASKVLIPQQKDKFILISAGADGIYGTADDIRN